MKIVKHNEEIQVHEAVCYLKQHGSFAGMPTVQSRVDLNQAAGEPIANGGVNNIQKRHSRVYLNVVNRMNDQTSNYDSIPRNQSISGFVRDKFAEVNSVRRFVEVMFLSVSVLARSNVQSSLFAQRCSS